MDDRELLERAAKAAGYTVKGEAVDAGDEFTALVVNAGYGTRKFRWNPLTDDGDALRLAVKVLNWPHGGRAFDSAVTTMYAVGQLPKDPYVATRRAIVLAAAAMGESS